MVLDLAGFWGKFRDVNPKTTATATPGEDRWRKLKICKFSLVSLLEESLSSVLLLFWLAILARDRSWEGGKQYVFGFKISQILRAVSWMVLFWAVASLWVIFWVKLFHFYPDSLILNVLFLRKWPRKQNLNDLLKVRAYEGGDTFWNFSAVDEPNQHRMLTENLFWCIFFAKKISLQWTQPNRGRDEQNRRKN